MDVIDVDITFLHEGTLQHEEGTPQQLNVEFTMTVFNQHGKVVKNTNKNHVQHDHRIVCIIPLTIETFDEYLQSLIYDGTHPMARHFSLPWDALPPLITICISFTCMRTWAENPKSV